MNNICIPFSPPDISESEINEVIEALRSGWITTGPRVKMLEKRLASYLGTRKAVCLNSQTACAEMALRLLDIGPGDEIIVPAYTYTATASVVCHVGAKLVMVDSQPGTFEMDYDQVAAAITDKTKAIIPVDLGGVPCDYDRLFQVIESKRALFAPASDIQEALSRIAILADSAHAIGASYRGKMVGSIADFSAFSFHAVKNLTTAEGGVLTWRAVAGISDEEIYRRLQLLSLHGQSKDALAKTRIGTWEYDVMGPWYKCNMTDIMAAIGLAQLERYPHMLKRRREIIKRYDAAFRPLKVETMPHYTNVFESAGHLYITHIPGISEADRADIIEKMAGRGVACNVHYKPLPLLTAYKNLGFDIADFPEAHRWYKNEITLPLHTSLTDEQIACIIENYSAIVKEYLK